ncbi:hypothetical protein [Halomicrobium urmianum]|uniref:hypothetical protein n=1 Tax=Halomicrobium urmianum TaxID=1586233 RepID=UPI001CD9EA97|nr:hypothetical protein [Halomicrobium urmianum]
MSKDTSDGLYDADRRSVLKYLGTSGVVAAGSGLGLTMFSGSGAAASADISASNPEALSSDDGTVDEVFIKPSLSVSWDGFDDVVGKVRILVEAATGASDLDPPEIADLDFMPVFRATGYANGTDNDSEEETGPGTSGQYQINWFDGDRRITLFDEDGAPDYENAGYNCGATMESYLSGTLMGDPIDGAQNGFYGAAGSTDAFEETTDAGTNDTTVYLRYTISLHRPDISFVTEDNYALDAEDVRPFSPLAMVDGDGGQYPDLTAEEYGTTVTSDDADDYDALSAGDLVHATAVPYGVMQDSTDHPALMTSYANFTVTVDNEQASANASGDTGAGAEVDEDVETIADGDNSSDEADDAPADVGNGTVGNGTVGNGTADDGTSGNETNDT